MSTRGAQQTTNSGTTLVCVCADHDDPRHIHRTKDGVRFIEALNGPLVLGGAR
jgi:hypothetical protein